MDVIDDFSLIFFCDYALKPSYQAICLNKGLQLFSN
jgi:hypothetical protein